MERNSFAKLAVTAALLMCAVGLSKGDIAEAAEVKIMCGTGAKGAVTELGRQFEAATGHKLVLEFGGFIALKRKIDAGEAYDLAILSPAMIDDLVRVGKGAAGPRAIFGRTGVGVAVRKGAPRPEIGSVDAFKRTMLDADSVAYSKSGISGKVFLAALGRLGISGEMKPRIKAVTRPEEAVIAGEAEIGVTGIGAILAAPAAELVGGLPSEIQSYVVYVIGASASSNEPETVKELIQFLTAPAAVAVKKAKGIETD